MVRSWLAPVVCTVALIRSGSGAAVAQPVIRQGGEFQVNLFTELGEYDPSVAVDADGDFVVVWTETAREGDGGQGIWGLRFNSSGVFQATEFHVNTYTPSIQHRAQVVSESNGDFVVVWQDFTQAYAGSYTVFGQRFTSAGARIGIEFQVSSLTTLYSWQPKIASDSDGDFVVVWESSGSDGSSGGIVARRFNSSGNAIGIDFLVNRFTSQRQGMPMVASDSDGDFVVVWESFTQDQNGYGVFARRFTSAGAAVANEFQVNTYTINNQYLPTIALEADGDFMVAWQSLHQDGDDLGIFARRFTSSGVAQGREFMVNAYTLEYQRKPNIGADAGGAFVVTWEDQLQDGSEEGTFGRRITAAGTLGREFQVNSYTGYGQNQTEGVFTSQAVDFDADGDFVVVWFTEAYQDGGSTGVFAQRYKLPPLAIIDVDGNGLVNAFGDGLLILKYLIGLRDANLVSGNLIGNGCSRCDASAVGTYIESIRPQLDVDGNGLASAFSDGLLILKYLIGLRDANLVSGNLIAGNCTPPKCTATGVGDYIETLRAVP